MRQWFRTAEPLGERRYENWNTHTHMSCLSGALGLVDSVFAVHAGSRGFDFHRRHMAQQFFRYNRPGYPHPVRTQRALNWKLVVSEWRSVIAVSLNVGGGVRLIKPAKLYMCTQTHYKHDEDGRTAPGVRGHGSVPLNHSGNVVTRIGLHTPKLI